MCMTLCCDCIPFVISMSLLTKEISCDVERMHALFEVQRSSCDNHWRDILMTRWVLTEKMVKEAWKSWYRSPDAGKLFFILTNLEWKKNWWCLFISAISYPLLLLEKQHDHHRQRQVKRMSSKDVIVSKSLEWAIISCLMQIHQNEKWKAKEKEHLCHV